MFESAGLIQRTAFRIQWSRRSATCLAGLLLALLTLKLCTAGLQQSQTFDEADHILAGYRYWVCSDFSANAEHPPLVKLIAGLPLLAQTLRMPISLCGSREPSTNRDFLEGRAFLYANNADSILFYTRLFASVFTIALGALLFESALAMFGPGAALIALVIYVFEPNILAQGFLVTTDLALACCLYAVVYAFYLYLEKRTTYSLVITGVMAGMALGAKHSGILVIPVLATLALASLLRRNNGAPDNSSKRNRLFTVIGALVFIALVAYVTLWGFYGFRFSARPEGTAFVPAAVKLESAPTLKALTAIFSALLEIHFLPESYLFGLKHVLAVVRGDGLMFFMGKLTPMGVWFYFPVVLLVKSTIGFLLLLLVAAAALYLAPDKNTRALDVLAIAATLILVLCLPAKLNIGVRHVLPVYPFLIMLAAAGAWRCSQSRGGKYLVAILIAAHVVSSLATFPDYIPYSNEAFGGTARTYQTLGESNLDWGQSLQAIKNYVRKNAIKDCWIAYLTSGDPTYYQTGCKFLPSAYEWLSHDDMSGPEVEGTLFIGANELVEVWGPVEWSPYAQFWNQVPLDIISGTVLVFRNRFELPRAFAVAEINRARAFSQQGRTVESIEAARRAVASAPDMYSAHAELANALRGANQIAEARNEYRLALSLIGKIPLELTRRESARIQTELQALSNPPL